MGTMRLGEWGAQLDAKGYLKIIETCLEEGIDTFDLADIYGDHTTEAEFGQALALSPGLRDKIQIITKCGICRVCDNRPQYLVKHYDTSANHIIQSAETALKDLRTDYLDQLLIHRPDALMDFDEVAEAFTVLQKAGKVKAFGVSNFSPRQFDVLNSYYPLITNQIQANLLHLDPFIDGTLDQLQQHRLRPQAWSPLGGGAVFAPAGGDEIVDRIRQHQNVFHGRYGLSPDQVLLAWLLRHPAGIRPILGTSKVERIRSAAKAQATTLNREDWYTLWSASTGQPVP
ncbi:UNVERIFIED_CONTAM: hypothetical protein GTU68_061065 [Idotea baltica]|nr:hypothetical protein [Idotea baltica]